MSTRRELVTAGAWPGADPLVLDLGAPTAPVQWDLRRLTVMVRAAPQTVILNVVTIVVTPRGSGPPGVIDPTQVVDATPFGLPAPGTWSRGTIILLPEERLQAWIYAAGTALVAGTELIATAQVEEDPYP